MQPTAKAGRDVQRRESSIELFDLRDIAAAMVQPGK
jgi:hypothetical protein